MISIITFHLLQVLLELLTGLPVIDRLREDHDLVRKNETYTHLCNLNQKNMEVTVFL